MNYAYIIFILGRLLQLEAIAMIVPIFVAILYKESSGTISAFLGSMTLLLTLGTIMSYNKAENEEFYALEGFVLVSLGWIAISFFGALPFYFSGQVPSFVDALFESTSGFSTTGASVLDTPQTLSHSILFWRSFTLFLGGMGMLVFIITLLPKLGSKGIHVMKAELTGPTFGKLESRVSSSIRILYAIYVSMTLTLILLLILGNVPAFEAILLAFGAAGTGGFNLHSDSIVYYDSRYVEFVIGTAMVLFGVNFNLYYLLYLRRFKSAFRNEQLKWYLIIIAGATFLIAAFLWPIYSDSGRLLFDAFFAVSSVMSTTAYTTVNIGSWPVPCHIVLLFLMFTGAMSGSTTSGLKVGRIVIFAKMTVKELKRAVNPNRVLPVMYEHKRLTDKEQISMLTYLVTYAAVIFVLIFFISMDTNNFTSAFSAVVSGINNIGYSLDLLGPAEPYSQLANSSKLLLCLTMIMGRLELYPILILFRPRTWSKY